MVVNYTNIESFFRFGFNGLVGAVEALEVVDVVVAPEADSHLVTNAGVTIKKTNNFYFIFALLYYVFYVRDLTVVACPQYT